METVFRIRGLDCAHEVKLLRDQLGSAPGVESLGFDVLRARMSASYDPAQITVTEIMRRVEAAGLRAEIWQDDAPKQSMRGRLLAAGLSGLALLAAMAATARPLEIALSLVAIGVGVIYTAPKAWSGLLALRFDMNVLMVVSANGACYLGEWTEGATLAFLFAVANLLEIWSLDRARGAISALMADAPREAVVLHGRGAELKINCCGEHRCDQDEAALHEHRMPVDHVAVGSLVRVRPGEKIPIDGKVKTGSAGVNQATITGEAIPVFKQQGDPVYAGTLNTDGLLDVRTSAAAADTALARIVRMVEESQSRRAPSEQFVERFARFYTPAVIAFAFVVFLGAPFALGWDWHRALYQSMVVLLISCPCALVISTPVTIAAALASAARNGVLIKGGSFLEAAGRIRAFAFDKTGVVTAGEPEVAEVVGDNILPLAASLEAGSEHPLAKAVLRDAQRKGVQLGRLPVASHFRALPGRGATAVIDGVNYWIGNRRLLEDLGVSYHSAAAAAHEQDGRTLSFLGTGSQVLGFIAFADRLRPGIAEAVASLHALGVRHTSILTGDNQAAANAAARSVGIDDVQAELLPDDKVTQVRSLMERFGVVGMAGDGINDAQAMSASSVGIAIGKRSTDVAIESADVVLMSEDPSRLGFLIRHSRRALSVVKQNLVLALGSKLVFLVIAMLGMATLWMAIAADMGATLAVTFNGLRMLRARE